MTLNAHDRRVLAQIEEAVAGNDPRFAASLSAFDRLADGGVMPERERIRPGTRSADRPGRRRPPFRRPEMNKLMYWIAVAMAVSITLAVIVFVLVNGHSGGKEACAAWQAGICVKQSAPSVPASSSHKGHTSTVLAP